MDSSERPPRVCVVVLNWNGLADTLECLKALRSQQYDDAQVVVVDNGSRSSEADEIEVSGLATAVVRNRENLGFAGGSNVGIRSALEHGADYIWLLTKTQESLPTVSPRWCVPVKPKVEWDYLARSSTTTRRPQAVKCTGTIVDFDRQDRTHLTSLEDMAQAAHADDLASWGSRS